MGHVAEISLRTEMTRRRCLACGCSSRALQRPVERRPSWCPGCGDDLYARPPRSYAEMEGLILPAPRPDERRSIMGLVERSLAIAMGVVATLGLFASAMR